MLHRPNYQKPFRALMPDFAHRTTCAASPDIRVPAPAVMSPCCFTSTDCRRAFLACTSHRGHFSACCSSQSWQRPSTWRMYAVATYAGDQTNHHLPKPPFAFALPFLGNPIARTTFVTYPKLPPLTPPPVQGGDRRPAAARNQPIRDRVSLCPGLQPRHPPLPILSLCH